MGFCLVVLGTAAVLPTPSQAAEPDRAIFLARTCTTCAWDEPSTWRVVAGRDRDGVPDGDDDLIIPAGVRITYAGMADGAIARNLVIKAGGELSLGGNSRSRFWIRGQLRIEGAFRALGAHELFFESDSTQLSGIYVVPGGDLEIVGVWNSDVGA